MATHKPTLQELCYPGVSFVPSEHISSSPPTPKVKTLQEHCYPDITYEHLIEYRQNKLKSSLRRQEQLNTNSKSHWPDIDLIPPPLSFADDIEQRKWKIKAAIIKSKYHVIPDPATFISNLEDQVSQLEQLVSENRSRETLLDESISKSIPNQFTSSDLEISAPYLLDSIPLPVQTHDISKFNQVLPITIPSDSISNFSIQFESEPTPFHLSTLPQFEPKTQNDDFQPWYKILYDQFYDFSRDRRKLFDHSSIFEDEHWCLDDLFKEDPLYDQHVPHPKLLNEHFVDDVTII